MPLVASAAVSVDGIQKGLTAGRNGFTVSVHKWPLVPFLDRVAAAFNEQIPPFKHRVAQAPAGEGDGQQTKFSFDPRQPCFDYCRMRVFGLFMTCVCVGLFSPPVSAAGKARHVVVVVWDGMRPDFVTEKFTPTLYQLAHDGVFFQNHHPVYLSSTEVNGTAIATGAYPEHSHVMANSEYRPDIDPRKPVGTESLAAVRKGDTLTQGHYLNRPTIAEILQGDGRRTAVAGAKPVALLQDRAARTSVSARGVNLFEGITQPTDVLGRLTNQLGAFPPARKTKADRDAWTTRALTGPEAANSSASARRTHSSSTTGG
jgi:hypothetical protein